MNKFKQDGHLRDNVQSSISCYTAFHYINNDRNMKYWFWEETDLKRYLFINLYREQNNHSNRKRKRFNNITVSLLSILKSACFILHLI